MADGGCRLALGGQGAQRLLHPVPETVQQWPGARLAYRAAILGRLAANLFLDSVQGSDAQHRLGGRGRSVSQVNVVELTSGVIPTGHLIDSACAIEDDGSLSRHLPAMRL